MTPVKTIIEAIKAGDQEKVGQLLKENPELAGARSAQGESAILMAVYRGRSEILEMVLAANPETDIFEASAAGQLGRVKSLAAADPASVNLFSRDGFTPLGLASFFGQRDVVECLLASGAKPDIASSNELSVMPLHSAAAARHNVIVELLLKHGADPNARQRSGFTPLHSAAHNGQMEMVELLLNHGAGVHARSEEGLTPLRLALDRGHESVAERLRRQGAVE